MQPSLSEMPGNHASFFSRLGQREFIVWQMHVCAAVDVVPNADTVGSAACLKQDTRRIRITGAPSRM